MVISFIIPVYKVESYLRQCVDSITCQTYRDIEVILVDDGSPDNSPQLCDLLAREDNRIRVIHKENGGLSDARNAGLKAATGDYVAFVDGDDFWLSRDDLSGLLEVAEKQSESDFIGYNCKYYYPDTENYSSWVAYSDKLLTPVDKNTAVIELVKSGTFPMSACLKLMKRDFLVKNDLFFVKGQIAEDIPWFINVLDTCDKCSFINQYVYSYRQNVAGSITKTSGRRSFDSLFDIFKTEIEKVEDRSFNHEAQNALRSFWAYEYCILLTYLHDFDRSERKSIRKELHQYKGVLQYTENPKVKKVSLVYRMFGIRVTEFVLDVYQFKRKHQK